MKSVDKGSFVAKLREQGFDTSFVESDPLTAPASAPAHAGKPAGKPAAAPVRR